ncbi:MAG: glycine--tRNA ligase [Candidatus Diapherotrites archaeon]|nr:glycine--tRNA ligase [Candidatus Diapherotrites archaeon]
MPREELQNLALRRQLFYPTAEIYANAPAGFWEFGPIGVRIRNNIIAFWRKELVERERLLEIHGSVILPRAVFEASGHLKSFNDPIVQCKKCHALFRADKLIEEKTGMHVPESMSIEEIDKLIAKHNIKCPKCRGALSNVRLFNMMMRVLIGATQNQECFLRPETCQNIFLDFLRLYKASRQGLPLGIAQAGSSFRNEIAPKQTLLRERELGQMEIEIFFNPDKINDVEHFDEVADYKLMLQRLNREGIEEISCEQAVKQNIVSGKLIAYWLARLQQFYEKCGIAKQKMRFRELDAEERAFYAKETWDFEVLTDLGWIELVACNYRTDYDLKGHSLGSKKDLSVKEDNKAFIPHVFELSAGIDRTFYVVLDQAIRKEKRGKEERLYLDLPVQLAPYLVAVFPLVSKDGLPEKAHEVFTLLEDYEFFCIYDEKGSIGRRYARVDEIGVPYAITIDYDTMKDDTVTIRERNTMKQKRVAIESLPELLWKLSVGKLSFQNI